MEIKTDVCYVVSMNEEEYDLFVSLLAIPEATMLKTKHVSDGCGARSFTQEESHLSIKMYHRAKALFAPQSRR